MSSKGAKRQRTNEEIVQIIKDALKIIGVPLKPRKTLREIIKEEKGKIEKQEKTKNEKNRAVKALEEMRERKECQLMQKKAKLMEMEQALDTFKDTSLQLFGEMIDTYNNMISLVAKRTREVA